MRPCKSCGAKIAFAYTRKGGKMPINSNAQIEAALEANFTVTYEELKAATGEGEREDG